MTPAIAIVGMACRYPDANSPQELWDNVLAQRSAFRKIPHERLSLADYFSEDRQTPDAIYSQKAALIRDYSFDRHRFRTVGSTFRSADLSHWLALEVAADALTDAGFPDGENLPKTTTGVILGNTLTGEMSRANTLRLRWPYVRRTVGALLETTGMTITEQETFLSRLEVDFKAPFEPIGSESLAGNLANTIAGRICNHFDLHGGGYTVDGACSSSLLAVTQACNQLLLGDLDVVIAGGVDISIDPFELVGFAKVGALSPDQMLVYDQRSDGFIPGEGCGMVVLMSHETAIAQHKRIYAVIQGWGVSSDGQGGMTRPEAAGQKLAIQKAYRQAQWKMSSVGYFEGHGTGTVVGDATELQALTDSRQEMSETPLEPAVIGSIKANIGHTKAAAGIAGLIKATLAVYSQVLPPTSACQTPQERLNTKEPALRIMPEAVVWPHQIPLRAGVSAMGFGGINSHIALENPTQLRRSRLSEKEQSLIASQQDAELLLFSAENVSALRDQLAELIPWIDRLSRAELGDIAHTLVEHINEHHAVRAAVVAENVPKAISALKELIDHLKTSDQPINQRHLYFNAQLKQPRIGLLFPGQAAPVYTNAGLWGRRFAKAANVYHSTQLPEHLDRRSTQLAQPAIIASTLVGLQILEELHIQAVTAIGHSLGELAALHWAGAFDTATLLQLACQRGLLMQTHGTAVGTMASIEANAEQVEGCLPDPQGGQQVSIAGVNSPRQTVIAGDGPSVTQVVERARQQGLQATLLPVSQAFHSPLMASVVPPLRSYLQTLPFAALKQSVISTVTGNVLEKTTDLKALLVEQVTQPVRFLDALSKGNTAVDLWLEVGPGHILSHCAKQAGPVRSIALDSGSQSLAGLLEAVAAVFTLGGTIHYASLFQNRFHRSLSLQQPLHFFQNPCELAPDFHQDAIPFSGAAHRPEEPTRLTETLPMAQGSHPKLAPLEQIRQLVALRTELPLAAIADRYRFLSDLHLNSITVGQLVSEAAQRMGVQAPSDPTAYANSSLVEMATALQDLPPLEAKASPDKFPAGVASWLRAFEVAWQPEALQSPSPLALAPAKQWEVFNLSGESLPEQLTASRPAFPGRGCIVVLPAQRTEAATNALLKASQKILATDELDYFVLLHSGWGSGFAKTLHLENPQITTLVLDLPLHHPQMMDWLAAEIGTGSGFVDARYEINGERFCPYLQLIGLQTDQIGSTEIPDLTASDCLLVTGGGKGIAAECALAIAQQTGCVLALLGRSDPAENEELTQNLERMQAHGIEAHYFRCDVGVRQELQDTIHRIEASFRPITAVLHGAGINKPKLLTQLTPADVQQTFTPKVTGLTHLLDIIPGEQLKQLITFGSIIARTGLPGEADYALANEQLGLILEDFQQQHPHCHCLNMEWSVWSGTGMGERLGRIDSLMQQGISAITPDQGIQLLKQLMRQKTARSSVVVSSRFGTLPTLKLVPQELPLLRFLERPRVFYPGIELVVDVDLSLATDPYLRDHVYQGEFIFPGVMGLEAMAQVANALAADAHLSEIQAIQFHRPIVVPATDPLTIRIAAIARSANEVEVEIRSAQTGFAVQHFQATYRVGVEDKDRAMPRLKRCVPPSLEINSHLYGELLFHQGRFRRIQKYDHLAAKSCVAEIQTDALTPWFSPYLSQTMILGDAGARDAVIHALQACVPHATILPIGIQRIQIHQLDDEVPHQVTAIEQAHVGDQFIYDVWVTSANGEQLETWRGLSLQIIQPKSQHAPWSAALLPPYLERCISDEHPQLAIAFSLAHQTTADRREMSDRLLQQLTGSMNPITRRSDGKPDPIQHQSVSASHCDNLTLVVAQRPTSPDTEACQVACDLELVSRRQQRPWQELLGDAGMNLARLVAQETAEPLDVAATRIWSAQECLKKAGFAPQSSLTLLRNSQPIIWLESHGDCAVEKAQPLNIATWMFRLKEMPDPMVIAILTTTPAPVLMPQPC